METMEEIKAIRVEIKDIYEKLTKKKGEVYNNYLEYVDKNKKNNFFGLDSLHFQNKLFELEYESLTKQYNFIDNRIYCDFYKLFGLITQFLKKNYKDNFDNLLKNKNYPIYKDLEQYKVYEFNTVNDIHHDIIVLIKYLFEKVDSVKNEIEDDTQKMSSGLNIANYIYNFIFSNNVTESNVKLFEDYLKSYHSYHKTVLNNLKEKLVLMLKQLDPPGPPGPNPPIESSKITQTENDFEMISENKVISQVVSEPVVEPVSEPLIEPVVEPVSEPVIEELVELVVPEPVVEPVVVPDPEPVVEELNEPVVVPDPEPVVEELNEPVVVPDSKPVVEEVIESVVEEVIESVVEEVIESVVEVIESVVEVIESVVDQVIEVIEPVVEVIEPVVDQVIEVIEEVIDPVVDSEPEPVVEPVVDPVVDPEPEPVVEPVESVPEMNNLLQNPLHNFKIINIIDYIKESTPLEVKNHIINKIKSLEDPELQEKVEPQNAEKVEPQNVEKVEPLKIESHPIEAPHIPIKNPSEPIQNKKNKKNKRR